MPVLLPCSSSLSATPLLDVAGIHASLHRDGITITLRVLEYTYFSFDETEVVSMPRGEERWQRLIGRRYHSFASAAQEAHVLVFGTRCDYMRAFHVYCVPHAVHPRLPTQMDYSSDRCSNILAVASHVEAHAHTRIEVRPFADGTVTASWRPIGMLRPAISLAHEPVAVAELNALVVSARAEREREAAARAVGDRANRPKPPRHERADKDRKRPRDEPGDGTRPDSDCRGSSSSAVAKKPKYRLSDKPGTVVWERDVDAAIAAMRAPMAYIVRESRKEEPRVPGGSPKVLLVEPLPVGSRNAEWIHASELASMEEHVPRIWHCEGGRVTDSPIRAAIEQAVERAFVEHHRSHATHLTRETLWNGIMRVAGKPTGAPAFACG